MATSGTEGFDDPTAFLRSWRHMATSAMRGVRAANHALLAPMHATSAATRSAVEEDLDVPASIPSVTYERADWSHSRTVENRADIEVGDVVTFTKHLSRDDVEAFARISGDTNRLHLDESYAAETRFKGPIVHGTLVSGMISAALARLPGLSIYLSQDLEFLAPVPIGTEVTATAEVLEVLGGDRYRLRTTIDTADGERVVDGEAIVLIDPVDDE
ncbi:MAG: MaoC family dehydratase [Halobacteriota archaeon]